MAINVTQKDKTLQQVIDWCGRERDNARANTHSQHGLDFRVWNSGKVIAFDAVIKHCETMLGYSGSMTDEVPNQSEDARQETGNA